ncbi:MAG: VanZ family protein [Thiobacillus sp.]|nr:VanZ family protein [Thiobacillus sp.]
MSGFAGSGLSAESRRGIWLLALAYTVCVVYGSLVPLDFHARPWDEALAAFHAIPFLELGPGSRADWVANLILYLPLGFFWMGVSWGRAPQVGRRVGGTLLAALWLVTLATTVEFFQLYFPPRTVSLNDLYAEWLGAALGMALWPLAGRSLAALWRRFKQGGALAVRAALVGYALLYLFLSLFPYDFLLTAAEWRAHLDSGKVGWLFAETCGAVCGVKLIPEMLAAVPFGLLLRARARRVSLAVAGAAGFGMGLTIELVQLSIGSGISQGASVLSRAAGVVLGAALPGVFAHWDSRRTRPWVRAGILVALVPYALALAWLNRWFTEDWTSTAAALDRLTDIRFIPFYYHYYTSEGVALVSLIFQLGLYAPIGIAGWFWKQGMWRQAHGAGASAMLATLAATTIEAGKLFILSQHADPTNILIAGVAAGGSHRLLIALFSAASPPPRAARASAAPAPAPVPAFAAPTSITADDAQASGLSTPPDAHRARPERHVSAPLLAAGLVIAAVASLIGYPPDWLPLLVPVWLVLAAICWRWAGNWVFVVPAALPLLDLSYLSGRLFWNEFDTLLLLVLAAGYARPRVRARMIWPGRWPFAAYGLSASLALAIGLWPLAPLDLNAFTHYTSPYNALHAVKGLAFAVAFLPLIQSEWHRDASRFTARLTGGMVVGLALELAYVVWERATYSGLWNVETGYRITGSFPGMHIGGASIEAYLVLAAPFVWLWAWQQKRVWAVIAAAALYALAAYGVMVTFSRGGQVAFAVATLMALAGFGLMISKTRKHGIPGMAALIVGVVVAGLVAWPIVSGKFSQARFATVEKDIGTRTAHWQDALNILSQAGNAFVGAGAGTFPAAFYWYSAVPARPAAYAFHVDGGNAYLRLGGGESLYFEQLVAVDPDRRYRLRIDLRSSADAAVLTVPLCEKALLYSFTCAWGGVKLRPGTDWQRHEIVISTDGFGPPGSLLQRPVKFSMFNQDAKTLIDVDNVSLLDAHGRDLIRNGDFSHGMQNWFFSTDSHLAWHAKNLFVHVLFEQGWLGLGAFLMLLAVTAWTLLRRATHDALAVTLLVGLAAFLIVGTVDSLIDEPRLDFLFFWLLSIALVSGGKLVPRRRRSRVQRTREPNEREHPPEQEGAPFAL